MWWHVTTSTTTVTTALGPVSLVLDKRIVHDRWGSSSNPSLDGCLHYPTDKSDIDRTLNESVVDKILQYRPDYNNRPSHVISFMPVIPGTWSSPRWIFETYIFVSSLGNWPFSCNFTHINLVSIFRCSSSPDNPVYVRNVDPSVLTFSLSLHRHPNICIPFRSRFICCS